MTPEEINRAIREASAAIQAGHKFELSALENKVAALQLRVAKLEARRGK